MTLPALYKLTGNYLSAQELICNDDADEQMMLDTLEAIEGEIEVKASNIAQIARNLEAFADSAKAAEDDIARRRKAAQTKIDWLKRYLKTNMEACGMSKITSPYFDISIRKNPASVDVFDADAIPAEFMRQPETPPPAPDKKAIKAAIDSGLEVPGARISNTTRLEIK